MPTIKLTKRALDGIKPGSTTSFWYDADLKGYGLKVMPSGVMTWIVEYRPGAGGRAISKRRMALGKAGALTPEEARAIAKDILAKVHAGQDPAALKVEAKAAKTVADLCDLYLTEAEQGNIISKRGAPKKVSTLISDRGRILRHIKPLLGKKLVRDVSRADIERFLRDVANGKTAVDVKTKRHGRAIVTGGKGTATRTVRLLGGIFSHAFRQSDARRREICRQSGRAVPLNCGTRASWRSIARGGDSRDSVANETSRAGREASAKERRGSPFDNRAACRRCNPAPSPHRLQAPRNS